MENYFHIKTTTMKTVTNIIGNNNPTGVDHNNWVTYYHKPTTPTIGVHKPTLQFLETSHHEMITNFLPSDKTSNKDSNSLGKIYHKKKLLNY